MRRTERKSRARAFLVTIVMAFAIVGRAGSLVTSCSMSASAAAAGQPSETEHHGHHGGSEDPVPPSPSEAACAQMMDCLAAIIASPGRGAPPSAPDARRMVLLVGEPVSHLREPEPPPPRR
jgi:hypothetical protein